MTAHVASVRDFTLGLPHPGDMLTVACKTCWPLTDGYEVFGTHWTYDQRDQAEAAAAQHNATHHARKAAA